MSRLVIPASYRVSPVSPNYSPPGPGLLSSPELIFETFQDDFDVAYREGTLFVLALHPHVVGMRSRIIDRLVEYIKGTPE